MDPQFLFRRAERHEDEVRTSGNEALRDGIFLEVTIERDRGTVYAGDLHPDLALETSGDRSGDPGRAAQQVDAKAADCRQFHQRKHQIGTGDLRGQRGGEQAGSPDQGLPIRERQACGRVGLPECSVVLRHHDVVHVRGEDAAAEACHDEPIDLG